MGDGWVRVDVRVLRIYFAFWMDRAWRDGQARASRTVCSSARARSASVFLVVVVILGKGGKRRVRDVSEGVLVAKDRNAVSTRGRAPER